MKKGKIIIASTLAAAAMATTANAFEVAPWNNPAQLRSQIKSECAVLGCSPEQAKEHRHEVGITYFNLKNGVYDGKAMDAARAKKVSSVDITRHGMLRTKEVNELG